jgi:hypothetical protein
MCPACDQQALGAERLTFYTSAMRFSPFGWLKRRKGLPLADDIRMQERDSQANKFYSQILLPDEEPGFVSDEATLRDVSLAPDDELIRKVQEHYGKTLSMGAFRKPFWSLLDDLELGILSSDQVRQETPPHVVLQALFEAAAWCSHCSAPVEQLRSVELDPSEILNIPSYTDLKGIDAYLQAKRESYHHAISALNQTRAALLRDSNAAIPDMREVQTKGKLLLYTPLETVSDGAASASSRGFYDMEDAPPWDTWFLYSEGTIFSYVPESLFTLAQAGIDANPVDCIHWATWSNFSAQLKNQ